MQDVTNREGGVMNIESAVEHLMDGEETPNPEDATEGAARNEAANEGPEEAGEEIEEAAGDEEPEAEGGEEEEDGAEEEPGEDEEEEEPVYTVKVDGEEIEVPLSELIAGYQKDADYRRKTAALAEERRALEAKAAEVEQLRAELLQRLERYAQAGDDEPDWAKLAEELDPWDFQKRRAAWEAEQREKQRALEERQAILMAEHQRRVQEGLQKLLEQFPEWRSDPQKMEADKRAMLEAARAYGFTDQEFYSATDWRVFVLLRDAMEGRKLREAAKKRPVAKKVPKKGDRRLKAGAKASPGEEKRRVNEKLREQLRKRGDVDSAVQFLLGGS